MYVFKKHYLLFAAGILFFCGCNHGGFAVSSREFPADGISSGKIVLNKTFLNITDRMVITDSDVVEITGKDNSLFSETVYFKSSGREGIFSISSESGSKLKLTFYKNYADIDSDSFPDQTELDSESDKTAFRGWFVRIAESQALKRSSAWDLKERDCAGFVRFCYREALRVHDSAWHKRTGISSDKNIPDVKKYNYPSVPVLGDGIFRTVAGFSPFADAQNLMKYNARLLSRDVRDAMQGDLLFFYNQENDDSPYHTMIVAGREGDEIFVIYHTGSDDIIKRVPLSYFSESTAFRPVEWNRNFLGVFRFLILE